MQIQTRERIRTSRNSVAKRYWTSTAPIIPWTEPFTIQEFVNAIKNLPSREAAGQDLLSYEHLKKNLNTIKTALMNIFNTVELSVPFDRFIDLCYQHKFNKYLELCNKCNELGYHTRIIILIIGPLGLVHNKFVNGLKVIGLTTSKAKAIAKYVSASAQIGSYLCWSCRMRKWMLLHVN